MKSAVAFVLAVLMFATPATHVLAQTPQQQDAPVRKDVPPAQPVTLEQSVVPELPKTGPMDALLPPPNLGLAVALNPGADEPAQVPSGLAVILIVVIVTIIVLSVRACDEDASSFFPKIICFG